MLREEFEQLTGIYPDATLYNAIENEYMDFDGDKAAFCKAYKANKGGLAQRIQRQCAMDRFNEGVRRAKEIEDLRTEINRLKEALEKEQEWEPCEDPHNVTQAQYDTLKRSCHTRELSDDEAKDKIAGEFGFDREKIRIVREVFAEERNRHGKIRTAGMKERLPLYNSTDWNYIAFDAAGHGYEMHNGELHPYCS